MDLLLIGVALVGLVLAKALLSSKERTFRRSRVQRKIQHILEDAARGARHDEFEQSNKKSETKAKPPPLPPEDDG